MIDKYYNGVIEQVVSGIGNVEHNSILVRYSNDFSIWDLESVNHYKDQSDIFFTCHEFSYNKIAEAYEPYLGLIRQMFHRYCSGTLEEFMEECDVYKLQRPVFESYFENGFCERTEQILIDEVEYEQERMRNSIVTMLQKLSEIRPVVIVLNRFQLQKVPCSLPTDCFRQRIKISALSWELMMCSRFRNLHMKSGMQSVRVWMTGTWCTISEIQAGTWNRMSWTITLIMRVTMAIGN